jgi:hypothetical protein
MRLGIIITPVAVQYCEHELRHILNVSQARAVLTCTIAGVDHSAMFRGLGVEVLFSLEGLT